MFPQFGLVLTVTHACNLRCSYCYTGTKSHRTMPEAIGRKAIDRSVASLAREGKLELGFFGGEPLLEAALITRLMAYAREQTAARGQGLSINITTNGTVIGPPAWAILTDPGVDVAVSCDGEPAVHDRHRLQPGGSSSTQVVATIRRLGEAKKDFRVVMVVRPDTVEELPAGIRFLQRLGVRHIEPSLDLWTVWNAEDIARLERAVAQCADLWRDGLPRHSIGWFDEKTAHLAQLEITPTARCGFGRGELAVAPSGRMYPCERLIGEDIEDNPMRLPGHVLDGDDFLWPDGIPGRSHEACDECAMLNMCSTYCRCSNYVRTGNIRTPDWLLCALNQACLTETARVLNEIAAPASKDMETLPPERPLEVNS